MAKKKLIDNIKSYYNNVMGEIKKIPKKDKDKLRGIEYTTEQIQESEREKKQFLDRFSNFIPKAEKILSENKKEWEKKYQEWKESEAPPKTTTKARAVLMAAIVTSVIAAALPVISVVLETIGFIGATWVAAASIPEIFGGSALLSRYDSMKANINADYNNWENKGDEIYSKINAIDSMIDTMHVLKFRIEYFVADENIMANEFVFQSIRKEAELLMESILNV
ncbi:MAG: hypothetical protein GF329_13675 [Candidatus Lokiarchaeota archaeon]|nr:hypothetical protein [Candidatus Lokiarchaeota archaeon]